MLQRSTHGRPFWGEAQRETGKPLLPGSTETGNRKQERALKPDSQSFGGRSLTRVRCMYTVCVCVSVCVIECLRVCESVGATGLGSDVCVCVCESILSNIKDQAVSRSGDHTIWRAYVCVCVCLLESECVGWPFPAQDSHHLLLSSTLPAPAGPQRGGLSPSEERPAGATLQTRPLLLG